MNFWVIIKMRYVVNCKPQNEASSKGWWYSAHLLFNEQVVISPLSLKAANLGLGNGGFLTATTAGSSAICMFNQT